MKLKQSDLLRAAHYDEFEKAIQFGNLHQRMKYLRLLAEQAELYKISNPLWMAICDLETEVKHYTAQNPPFGRRTLPPR